MYMPRNHTKVRERKHEGRKMKATVKDNKRFNKREYKILQQLITQLRILNIWFKLC